MKNDLFFFQFLFILDIISMKFRIFNKLIFLYFV